MIWGELSQEIEEKLKQGQLPALVARVEPGLKGIRVWNQIALWCFVVGILLLGIFVSRNLLAGSQVPVESNPTQTLLYLVLY
jgi:hypothetical protein